MFSEKYLNLPERESQQFPLPMCSKHILAFRFIVNKWLIITNMGCHTSRRGHISVFMGYWLDLNQSDMKAVFVIPSGLNNCVILA